MDVCLKKDAKSVIGISNKALDQLGIDHISSLTDETKVERTVSAYFQTAKEEVLRSYVFDWAHKAEKLIPYADSEGGYQRPADYINYIGLGTCECFCCCADSWENLANYSHKTAMRLVNGRMYIDSCCPQYEWLHYSFDNQNYSSIPAELAVMIAWRMAYLMCFALTGSDARQTTLLKQYELQGLQAKKFSGMENKPLEAGACRPRRYPFDNRY